MVNPADDPSRPIAEATAADAAAWLTRLHGPARTEATEQALREWLAADPEHARAFDRATELWGMFPRAGATVLARERRRRRVTAPVALAAGLAAVAVGAGLWAYAARDSVYDTAVGEQQSVTLSDGSRVTLNTGSRVAVDYRGGERRVRLDRGEALFQVAKNPQRPFVVMAGGEQVRALGTTFVVRREAESVAVTLIEGKVSVTPQDRAGPRRGAVLAPGQRLIVRADAGAVLDRPELEGVTAWRRGEAVFDRTSLIDAAAELNRYGGPRVVVGDATLGALKVSGVFATGDNAEFASAMARLHGLSVRRDGADLVLVRGGS